MSDLELTGALLDQPSLNNASEEETSSSYGQIVASCDLSPSPPRIGTELPKGTTTLILLRMCSPWKAVPSPTLSACVCVWFPVDILYCFNMFLNVSKAENLHNLLDHFPWERRNCKCQLGANEDQALLSEAYFTGWTSAGHSCETGQLVSHRGRSLSPRICVSLPSTDHFDLQ